MYFIIMLTRITIKDIAKALNIHHSTVSRALRNDSRVKEETRKMVVEYAEKKGYHTNMIALELRGKKRNTIAVVVPNINHRFFSNVVSVFANIASEQGYVVSVFQSNESLEREIQIIDTVIQHNFSGVIASISMESNDVEHFEKLAKHSIPLVMFDRTCKNLDVSKVLVKHVDIMEQAVKMLVQRGYKQIAHISGPKDFSVFGERQKGYMKAINELGLKYQKNACFQQGFNAEDGQKTTKLLFEEETVPDAIISDSSNLVYGIIKELTNRKLKIPEDVALVVFGENPALEILNPSIIRIIQPEKDIAQSAFELLDDKLKNGTTIKKSIKLSAKIVQLEDY